MHKISKTKNAVVALPVLLLMAVSLPAFAQGGGSSGSSGSDSTSGSGSSSGSGEARTADSTSAATTTSSSTETETSSGSGSSASNREVETEHAKLTADRQEVKSDKHELKAEKTTANKEKVCSVHKHGLETKFSHIVANSQRVEGKIDDVLTKAEAYQTNKEVTVDSSLLTAAKTAKVNAADAVASLQQAKPTIDCNSSSTASDVAAFKTQAATTRDSLKTYRQAVKAYLLALEQAKTSTSTTSTGGNQ